MNPTAIPTTEFSAFCWTVLIALITTAIACGAAAAQPDMTKDKDSTTKPVDHLGQLKGQRTTLTVEVWSVNHDTGGAPQRAANAIVRIKGSEDRQTTDKNGQANLSLDSTQKVTLYISVIGGKEICELPDLPIAKVDKSIKVWVVLSATVKTQCHAE